MHRQQVFASAALLLLLISCTEPTAHCLRFVLVPLAGNNSPALDVLGVAAKLQAEGHAVAVVVSSSAAMDFARLAAARHSSNTTAEQMQFIMTSGVGTEDQFEHDMVAQVDKLGTTRSKLQSATLIMQLQQVLAQPCRAILQDAVVMQKLHSLQADAIMAMGLPMSASNSDGCGCVLSHALGVPFVEVNGHPLIYSSVGTPQFGSGLTPADLKTWAGCCRNTAVWLVKRVVQDLLTDFSGLNPWHKLRKDAGLPRASGATAFSNVLAHLLGGGAGAVCTPAKEVLLASWLLEYEMPLAPHQVVVGPGSPQLPHATIEPPEVAAFIEGAADHGVVLVAFGSTIQSSITMVQEDAKELARGFAALAPIRVLWALKEAGLPAGLKVADLPLGSNTLVVPWADYNDVLGHPNTRLFVSHCGIHSVYEAAFHGVPVVGVPLQLEQAEHAAKLAFRGAGVVSYQAPAFRSKVDGATSSTGAACSSKGSCIGSSNSSTHSHFTADHIQQLIQKVLDDPSFAAAASGMSEALQTFAARRHPYARAADEIELAVNTLHVQQQDWHSNKNKKTAPVAAAAAYDAASTGAVQQEASWGSDSEGAPVAAAAEYAAAVEATAMQTTDEL